jgi:hypothetical protein
MVKCKYWIINILAEDQFLFSLRLPVCDKALFTPPTKRMTL